MYKKIAVIYIAIGFLLTGNLYGQKVTKVGPVCLTVKELSSSLKFYTDVLQFKHIGTEDFYGENHEQLFGKFGIHYKIAHLQLGDEYVDLMDYLTSGGRSIPETQQSNDLAFQHIAIVVRDMDAAFKTLQKHNVEFVSTVPQTIPLSNNAAAGIKAFYFHDIDNHNLELIYFPKGKGKAKWQNTGKEIFLGIDHTAIGVSNTSNSLQYWVNNLSLEKKGESHNTGTEQAHLNFVKNAELQITGLAAAEGLHRVCDARGRQRHSAPRSGARGDPRREDVQGESDSLQSDRDVRRLLTRRDRRLQARARPRAYSGHGTPHAWPRHRRRLRATRSHALVGATEAPPLRIGLRLLGCRSRLERARRRSQHRRHPLREPPVPTPEQLHRRRHEQ